MNIQACQTFLDGNCGVGVVFGFSSACYMEPICVRRTQLLLAGFVDNQKCKIAYEKLCSRYKVVYQSPLRASEDGDPKGYFLCVFDSK